MITREEYELLKNYRDIGFNWLARDKNLNLFTYREMPIRSGTFWNVGGALRIRAEHFTFVKWEDEKPTSIVDLINEYETHQELVWNSKKVVVPQFIALWIEGTRTILGNVSLFDAYDNLKNDIWDEVRLSETDRKMAIKICRWICDNPDTFIDAWRDGYEIEKEKLYIVELPNPNKIGNEVNVLMKNGFRQIIIKQEFGDEWKKENSFRLTEAEIKKDFNWAWQFAGEVE